MTQIEYEERAFLGDEDFTRIKNYLNVHAISAVRDDKQSYFYVLPDINLSITVTSDEVKLRYKGGQLGKGNGFEELEISIDPASLTAAKKLLTLLLGVEAQESFQFRINYSLDRGLSVALKYTEVWGYHLEAERVYETSEEGRSDEEIRSKTMLDELADSLGVTYITDEEMTEFQQKTEKGWRRGQFSTEEFCKLADDIMAL